MTKIKIICIIENSISHLNPVFNLFHALLKRGNNLDPYFFSHISFQSIIEENGFHFIECKSLNFGLENHEIFCQNYLQKLHFCLNENNFENRRIDLLGHVEKIRPNYIFVDSILWGDHVVLEKIKSEKFDFKIKNIQTLFNADFSTKNLPLHSRFVPSKFDFIGRTTIYLVWLRYWIIKLIKSTAYQFKFLGYTEFRKIKIQLNEINKTRNFKLKINPWNSFCPRLSTIETLLLLPKSVEFSSQSDSSIKHLGYFGNQVADTEEANLLLKNSTDFDKVILISQGSLQRELNSDLNSFYLKFLALVKLYPSYYFIASFDKSFLETTDLSGYANLYATHFLPQRGLLPKVDLFISHGGANSILESILSECPILITLSNSIFDQNGNAARIKFHGCGEFIDFNQPLNKWTNKVELILQQSNSYKIRIQQLKKKIVEEVYDLENLIFA
jgi:UDP:flavonoid glycosyltransferase YjiC (YdhE family)